MKVARKSGGVMETQEEESFKREVVTESIKKGLREKKVEGRKDQAVGITEWGWGWGGGGKETGPRKHH